MKKLLCNIMSIAISIAPITSILSCSDEKYNSNDQPITPEAKDEDYLINNNITNYWTARKAISEKYNISLGDFTLDWIDDSTLKLRPCHGTDFENIATNLIEYNIKTGFNSLDSSSKLSDFKEMIAPNTGEKIVIPYNQTLENNNDVENATKGYFNILQVISGIYLDEDQYDYSYTDISDSNDSDLKGKFTITSKCDDSDTVTLDIKSHAVAYDDMFDTAEIGGKIFLPDELKKVSQSDFSIFGALKGIGPTIMALVNKYKIVDWEDSALQYFSGDLESFYTNQTLMNPSCFVADKNYDDDQTPSSGQIIFGAKYDGTQNFDFGLFKADSEGYITKTIINFKDDIASTFFEYSTNIVQTENGEASYDGAICTNTPVNGLTDISSDDDFKNDSEISSWFANCYRINDFKFSSSKLDSLELKKEFALKLTDVTGYEIPDDQYLYDNVRIKEDDTCYFVYLNRYSTIYNNNVIRVQNNSTAGQLYVKYDKHAGSFCFKIDK